MDFRLMLNSLLLGIGLAMDAFSVSVANGLKERRINLKNTFIISGTFSLFQGMMPLMGWLCVHTVIEVFEGVEAIVPWISLVFLLFIGSKMIIESIRTKGENAEEESVGGASLIIQGIATSLDALSVGFTIAEYDFDRALVCVIIISAVTFVICSIGVRLGSLVGEALSGKAEIIGGAILIVIGAEIFISGIV